jgi:hypothetical protein
MLRYARAGGHEEGTIEIDRATWLPRRWTFSAGAGKGGTLAFEGYKDFDGFKIPAQITETSSGGSQNTIRFETVGAAPTFIRSPYDPPPASAADVNFDRSAGASLAVEKAPTGHLLVHPRINGRDVGWFIFDTGAGNSVISSEAARELKLNRIGGVTALGIGGPVESPMYRLDSMKLGPLTLEKPVAIDLDLEFLTAPLGRPIAGVVGYDVISRCIFELDLAAPRFALHDPAASKPTVLHGGRCTCPTACPRSTRRSKTRRVSSASIPARRERC